MSSAKLAKSKKLNANELRGSGFWLQEAEEGESKEIRGGAKSWQPMHTLGQLM